MSHPLRVSFRQAEAGLVGTCWCGRTSTNPDPRDMWAWLDDHEHEAPRDTDLSGS
ncbi:MAG: hypothetical protein ACRDYU_18445 [Actinomycetes bacterium]